MRSIRRPLLIGTVLAALVALPALFARPWADERFVMYMPEHLVAGNPLLLWDQVMREVTAFIDVGVFRPISRLGFYIEHWVVVRIGIVTGVAPNVVMSVVKVAMIALLLTTGLLTVNQYRRADADAAPDVPWPRVVALLPVVFAGSLVLINPAVHPLTLFPGLYLGTASIALLIPLWLGRIELSSHPLIGRRLWLGYGLAVLVGAVLASMIELAWLGLPLGLTHLAMLRVQQHGWRSLLEVRHRRSFRIWLAMAGGFGLVFVPARLFIIRYCASGACYDAAAPSFGGEFLALFPFRVGSALAPVGLLAQFRQVLRMMTRPSSALLIAFAVGLLAGALLLSTWRTQQLREVDGPVSRWASPILVYYGVVVVLAAVISAISSGLQQKGLNPAPWRETGFGWIAWAVMISVGLAVVTGRVRSRGWTTLVVALVVLTVTATTVINREDMRRVGDDAEGMLHITAGRQLVGFDESANADRCATIAGLRDTAVNDNELRKLDLVATYLDSAAGNNYGMLFCDPASR